MKSSVRTKILLWCSIFAALISTVLVFKVNVNSDMTKYLPDSSEMKKGLDILMSEFDDSAMSVPDVKIMISDLDSAAIDDTAAGMKTNESVEDVAVQTEGKWTLFSLTVPKSVDQKKLAAYLADRYGGEDTVTRTSQDGNTPDPMALIIGVTALIIILFIMCKSWVDPLLLLLCCGMAVAVNVGSNAFLPSVSITTNSIVGILQLVLSIDYSIILLNRYRQVRSEIPDIDKALSIAIRSSLPSVLSSALTTIVGLLMLCFMRLKIGMDLGGVLAKGVACSLIFTYTALPGLIRIFDRQIIGCHKRVPHINTDRLAQVIEKLSIPLSIMFVLIFAGGYILKDRTPIHFSTNVPSKIDEMFPPQNAIVLLYDNEDSLSVIPVLDEAAKDSSVQLAISYSALMQRSLTAGEMVTFIKDLLANELASGMVGDQPDLNSFLTEDNLKILYFWALNEAEQKMSFPQLISFIDRECSKNELFSQFGGEEFKEKIGTLKMVMQALKETKAVQKPEPESTALKPDNAVPLAHIAPAESPVAPSDSPIAQVEDVRPDSTVVAVVPTEALPAPLNKFDDKILINTAMGVDHLAEFMGSNKIQVKMVFSMAKTKAMTPLEFARFLSDDLFERKNLSGMVSESQKRELRAILERMEAAECGLTVVAPEFQQKQAIQLPVMADTLKTVADTLALAREAGPVVPTQSIAPERKRVKTAEERKLELLSKLVNRPSAMTSEQMTQIFGKLGEKVEPVQTELLYAMYGSQHSYNPEWTMTLEEIIARVGELIGEDIIGSSDFSAQLEGLRGKTHSIAAIVTTLPDESARTEDFLRCLKTNADKCLQKDHYLVGESVMFCEMKEGFSSEMMVVTLLTILAIFTIVAITFRSALTALILVMTVMSAVFINVCVSGIGGGSMLYLANLIVQSILMGASIDYGILFTSYYRKALHSPDGNGGLSPLQCGYRGAIPTIMTSGLIIVVVPGIMAVLLDDAMISPIIKALSIGTTSAFLMILFFLPAVLHTCRKLFR